MAVKAMDEGDYFFAANKFKEAETLIPVIEDAKKFDNVSLLSLLN